MAWKMIGEPKTRKLTRGLAEEFSGMAPAPHDRPLNASRCAIIKRALDMGRFRTCEWAKAYCEETKQTYRINGKHGSTVLAQMNGDFPKGICVVVEEYECPTLQDVADLYCTFDTRSSARSTGDINLIYSACAAELQEVNRLDINLAVAGMSYGIWEEAYRQRPPEERAQLSIANPDFVLWLVEILTGGGEKGNKPIRRAPVVGAMFRTWKKSKQAATEFWTAVRDESGSKPDCADRKLAKFLVTSRLTTKPTSTAKPASQRETFVKCIHAWNAWRSGESTNLNYHASSKSPAAK